jgi:hypothetical protein
MPIISQVIAETKQSITRPVILDIVRQIKEITKISPMTPILYADDIGKVYQPGSALTEDPTEQSLFPLNDKIVIEVDEEYDDANVLSTAVGYAEQLPIFRDTAIGVVIKPIYVATTVSINFKFKTTSKSVAERWRNDIRLRSSLSRDINLHQITYHYVIPTNFVTLLTEIHKLRENVGGYGDSFSKYFIDHSTTRLTEITNQAGSFTSPAIAETQMRVLGNFEFDSQPEKIENDEDNSGWIGSFTYKFRFDKVISCNMSYPVMIHNQILGADFRPSKEAYDIDKQIQNFPLTLNALNNFESQLQAEKYVDFTSTLTIPPYDEFRPDTIPVATVSVFNALCSISMVEPRNLINLRQLGDIEIDADILEFIEQSERPFITRPYQSVLHLSLYRSMSLARDDSIILTPELDVFATTDLSVRQSHRIRFSIVADLTFLTREALERLKRYPKAFVKIIKAVHESLRNNPGFSDLSVKGMVTRDDIKRYIETGQNGPASQRVGFHTTQFAYVVAHRANDRPK